MLTMAIVFFANPAPPPYKVFLQCTIGAWALGFLLRFLLVESVIVTILVAGLLLVYFKWAKIMFPPTLGVAVFLISDQTLMPPVGQGPGTLIVYALHWLVTPWLAGSMFFYFAAKLTSKLRAYVKTQLSLLKFVAAFADKTDADLIEAFKEIDDDGSGKLDNKELVQAWMKATGEELTPDQAQKLIDEVDDDKNGTLDQNEFIALIRKRCEQPLRSYADQFSDEKLIQIFEMYDDDGNNEMDADELVVAWKKVTDQKISTKEAQELINQGATNGNSTLDKDEFVQLVRAHA
jgi:Ca2+-binding EF-hand superfamily protein